MISKANKIQSNNQLCKRNRKDEREKREVEIPLFLLKWNNSKNKPFSFMLLLAVLKKLI